jgi:integrase
MAAIKSWIDYDFTIYEPSSTPYYRITYIVEGRRKQSSGGRTLKDAEKRVRALKSELDGAAAPRAGSDITVGELLDHYVVPEHHLGWGVRHAEEQARFVRLHVRPHLNLRKPARDLDQTDFERILGTRIKTTDSNDTLNSAIQMCRTLVTHARQHAGLVGDPMDGLGRKARTRLQQARRVTAPAATGDPKHVHVSGGLNRLIPSAALADKAAELYAAGRGPEDVLTADERELEILVSRFTGIRPGERHALTAGQCAADGSELVVDRTLAEAKGRRWVKPPKNGQSRTVTVPPPIRARLAARRARAITQGPDALLFPAPRGGHWNRSTFSRKFRPAMLAAGWSPHQSLRDLRHLYAVTALGDWGLPLEVVSGELGHHSPEFTSRRYLSRQQGYRDAIEQTFDQIEWETS